MLLTIQKKKKIGFKLNPKHKTMFSLRTVVRAKERKKLNQSVMFSEICVAIKIAVFLSMQ